MTAINQSQPVTATDRIRSILADYVPVAAGWLSEEDGSFHDPYETEYSENYAPANAAVLFAAVYRTTEDASVLRLFHTAVRRSVELLGDKEGVAPFCRVFLIHYSLMAMLLLEDEEREEAVRRYGPFLAGYEDDCAIVNTNCAALQWGTELFLDTLGIREASLPQLSRRLAFIEQAQLESGFINDEVNEREALDGMPIPYHAFTLFLLAGAFAVLPAWKSRHERERVAAELLMSRGLDWLEQAISADGTFAMVERSSHQTFTWGAFVALYAGSGLEDEGLLDRAVAAWLPYRHADGTYGCTPNVLPHSLRTGYESYTHLNMYNLLGLTGLAVAARLLERGLRFRKAHELPAANRYVDAASGYAFYRRGDAFFACTLRMHNRRYTPALQGFQFRLGGRALPLAEPRLPGGAADIARRLDEGVWEGYLLRRADSGAAYPDTTRNAAVSAAEDEDGFTLVLEDAHVRCTKAIRLLADGFAWDYRLELLQPIVSCEHVLPLVVHDGRHALHVREDSPQRLTLAWAGDRYALECDAAVRMGMRLERSLLSPSGVAAQLRIALAMPPEAAEAVRDGSPGGAAPLAVIAWRTALRRLP